MTIYILLVSLFCNAYVVLNYCVLMIFFFVIIFLYMLCNFVTYCFDLKAYCISTLFMVNSTFNPTCSDDGSLNVYICVCILNKL